MTLQELIDRAVSIATRGLDASVAPALAAEMVAEDLVSTVFQKVSGQFASRTSQRVLLRRAQTITFTNGVGTVPEEVFVEYMDESLLYDPDSPTTRYGWESQFSTFTRVSDTRIGYYSCNESTIYVIQPEANYDSASGLTGDLVLIIPCAIDVPASASGVIDCRDEILDDLVQALAEALAPQANRVRAAA